MKYCPICSAEYDDSVTTCPTDSRTLLTLDEWSPGTVIRDTYRVLGKIGRGGMGVVYRGQHISLDEPRALKVMRQDLSSDPHFVQRFLQEARTSARLLHANSVRMYDFAQAEDGKLFIAMEYVKGVSVRDLLARGVVFAPRRTVHILQQISDMLAVAHAQKIVHRDLKPDNVMLVREDKDADFVKVMDFGVASVRAGLQASRLTPPGALVGVGPYASPEQFRGAMGDELDGRSDLYSLGVTAYEMLSGTLPFKGRTTDELMKQVLSAPMPQLPAELGVPAAVVELVAWLMQREPERRPANALALTHELNLLLSQLGTENTSAASAAARPTVVLTPGPGGTPARYTPGPGATPAGDGGGRMPTPVPRQATPVAEMESFTPAPEWGARRWVARLGWLLSVLLAVVVISLGWQQSQGGFASTIRGLPLNRQLAAVESMTPQLAEAAGLLKNSSFRVCNTMTVPYRIDRIIAVWRTPQGNWSSFDSFANGQPSWTVTPGDQKSLSYSRQGKEVWDGSVLFYTVSMTVNGTSNIVLAGPWSNTLHGCLTPEF